MKKGKAITGWAIKANMKDGTEQIDPILVKGYEIYPIFTTRQIAQEARETSPVLSLEIIQVEIRELKPKARKG